MTYIQQIETSLWLHQFFCGLVAFKSGYHMNKFYFDESGRHFIPEDEPDTMYSRYIQTHNEWDDNRSKKPVNPFQKDMMIIAEFSDGSIDLTPAYEVNPRCWSIQSSLHIVSYITLGEVHES